MSTDVENLGRPRDGVRLSKLNAEERKELEFLRYFYDACDCVFGSDDVYWGIAQDYDGDVPAKYSCENED